ncbi:hypothetical protein LBMAG25_06410 [Bacteroidota bacterium]|nr:hypothetical protein LBMAG25_06410 [Bacteroidota bacterium]
MNEIKYEELLSQADLDFKEGYFQEAIDKLESIIEEEPTFGKAYNHLGWYYETKAKDYSQAERYYKLAIDHAPDYVAVYYNYAILLSNLRRFTELDTLLKKALDIKGIDQSTIYNEYGIMHELNEDLQTAIEYYTKCAKSTLNNDVLNRAKDSIQRCKTKLEL